jgi:hypothetical protein
MDSSRYQDSKIGIRKLSKLLDSEKFSHLRSKRIRIRMGRLLLGTNYLG